MRWEEEEDVECWGMSGGCGASGYGIPLCSSEGGAWSGSKKAEHLFLERECQSTLEKNPQRSGRRKRIP